MACVKHVCIDSKLGVLLVKVLGSGLSWVLRTEGTTVGKYELARMLICARRHISHGLKGLQCAPRHRPQAFFALWATSGVHRCTRAVSAAWPSEGVSANPRPPARAGTGSTRFWRSGRPESRAPGLEPLDGHSHSIVNGLARLIGRSGALAGRSERDADIRTVATLVIVEVRSRRSRSACRYMRSAWDRLGSKLTTLTVSVGLFCDAVTVLADPMTVS